MDCPKCGYDNSGNSEECASCGLIFSKWQARQQKAGQPEPVRSPAPEARSQSVQIPRWLLILLVIGIAISAQRYFTSEKQDSIPPTQQVNTVQNPDLSGANLERMDLPLERLDAILSEMNGQAAAYDIQFTREDLRNYFEGGRSSNLTPGYLNTVEEKAGISSPTKMELSSGDRKQVSKDNFLINKVKYNVGGAWTYAKSIPKAKGDISECWKCEGGSIKGGYSNCRNWSEYRWQPNFKKWSPYTEQDEYRGYEYMIEHKLYTDEVFDEARKRSETMLSREMPEESGLRENRIRQAILMAYNSRIHRMGALHRMEELRELLGQ